jgi:uncharacterized membrane protein
MRKTLAFFAFFAATASSSACVMCDKAVRDRIFDSMFYPNLLAMLSAFIVIALIVAGLIYVGNARHSRFRRLNGGHVYLTPVPLYAAALILGIGLGGFADGIILHQILQWHEMLSNKLPPDNFIDKSVNMFWDGVFHAFTLIVVLVGVVVLWNVLTRRDTNKSGRLLAGGMLAGWGIFNIAEGVIDHHILELHNVVEAAGNKDIANYTFLAVSFIFLFTGVLIARKAKPQITDEGFSGH